MSPVRAIDASNWGLSREAMPSGTSTFATFGTSSPVSPGITKRQSMYVSMKRVTAFTVGSLQNAQLSQPFFGFEPGRSLPQR